VFEKHETVQKWGIYFERDNLKQSSLTTVRDRQWRREKREVDISFPSTLTSRITATVKYW
jgi:hypothetical protein